MALTPQLAFAEHLQAQGREKETWERVGSVAPSHLELPRKILGARGNQVPEASGPPPPQGRPRTQVGCASGWSQGGGKALASSRLCQLPAPPPGCVLFQGHLGMLSLRQMHILGSVCWSGGSKQIPTGQVLDREVETSHHPSARSPSS